MKFKFWGVRGSVPVPGEKTIKYGGNTSCVSVDCWGHFVIFDGGSGIRELGLELIQNILRPDISIFFSHVHWDHIQGIPFFKPLFIKNFNINMYGEKKVKSSLEGTLKGQQQYPNFPISLEEIEATGAKITFTDLYQGQKIHLLSNLYVDCIKLSHPDGVFAYRIIEELTDRKNSLVYATDTEHRNVVDPRLLKLAENADVLIYDAQYTPEEYEGKEGMSKFDWGHSTYQFAVATAIEAKVKRLFLFHHDPEHNDKDIDNIVIRARRLAYEKINPDQLFIEAAFEGFEMIL